MMSNLSACCKFQEGYVNPSQKDRSYFGGNIKRLRVVDLTGGEVFDTSEHLSEKGFLSAGKSAYLFPKDSIVISKSGTIGQLGIIRDKMCGNRAIINIEVLNNADMMYIFYLLKYKHKELVRKAVGSIQKNLYVSALETVELCHNSKEEQKKISDVLSTIDKKIELNNKINSELEAMAKELYEYRFVQFDFPNENGKPYKSSGGKMVRNEELKREIPEGWEAKKIKNVIQHINTGLNPRQNFKLNDGGNIKYITVKNLTADGTLDFDGCDLITKESKDMINQRSQIREGDILFASIAPLGRCYLMYETPTEWEINESVFSIRSNDFVSPEYLYMYFMSKEFVKKAEHSSTGSVFSGIRIGTLEDIRILVPNKKVIEKFSERVHSLYSMGKNIDKQNQKLSELRDFLLPMLMNGQVTVK